MPETRCEDLINNLLNNGGIIIEEKQEGSGSLLGRTVIIKKDSCKFKIGYLNLGQKQLTVLKMCNHSLSNEWLNIPDECIKNLKEEKSNYGFWCKKDCTMSTM